MIGGNPRLHSFQKKIYQDVKHLDWEMQSGDKGHGLSIHSILFSVWRDTISNKMALWAEIWRFADKRSLEVQASCVWEFKFI